MPTELSESVKLNAIHSSLLNLRQSNDRQVLILSMEKLRNLARGNETFKDVIGKDDGSLCLINFLKSQDIELQRAAAKLLRSLSVSQETREWLTANGTISVLVNILEKSKDTTLKLAVTATLWNLSVNNDNKKSIVRSGAIPFLVQLLVSNNLRLKIEAVGALRNLSFDKECQMAIISEGALSALIEVLNSEVDKLKLNGAVTLRNLCVDNEDNLATLQREGVMDDLVRILNDNGMEFNPSMPVFSDKVVKAYSGDIIKWEDLVLFNEIGEGKYGNVFKAKYYNYPVACKILKKKLHEKDEESTLEELKLMRRLKHPNVVQFIGLCLNPQNQVVIVTELMYRGNLKEILPEVTSLSLRLKMGHDIANGLFWLHCHDIIHRDLKLANLLVAQDWTVKISDFGLSLDLSKGEVCHGFKGNIKYSPPEILRARSNEEITVYPYSEKTDVYAYGLILWELISLEPLFPSIKGKEELTKHILAGRRPLFPHSWPKSIQELLEVCWHDNPSKRPLFASILKSYESIVIDLMCPDFFGAKICRRLWKDRRNVSVPYSQFYKVFSDVVMGVSRIKKVGLKCFYAILCDYYEDTVSFEKFCSVIRCFGPLDNVDMFFKKIKDLVSHPAFHGLISTSKASDLVRNYFDETRNTCYLYRYLSEEMGTFAFTYIDKNAEVVHHKVTHNLHNGGTYKIDGFRFELAEFSQLHRTYKECFKLRKFVSGNPYFTMLSDYI